MHRIFPLIFLACVVPVAAQAADTDLNLALPVDTRCAVLNQAEKQQDSQIIGDYLDFVGQIYGLSNATTPFDPAEHKVVSVLAGVVAAYCRVFPKQGIRTIIVGNQALVKMQVIEYSAGL